MQIIRTSRGTQHKIYGIQLDDTRLSYSDGVTAASFLAIQTVKVMTFLNKWPIKLRVT